MQRRAHLLLSQMFWAVLWLPGYNPEDYTRMAERTADLLLNGMVAPGAQWASPQLAIGSENEAGPDFLTAGTELIGLRSSAELSKKH